MRRRTVVAFLVGLGLFVGGGAGAQTTTTSSTTTSSTTTSSTTTSSTALVTSSTSTSAATSPTTSTTVVNPCTGQPCTVDPPSATLSGSGGTVAVAPIGFCWREIGGQLSRCVSGVLAPDAPVQMVIRRGETLTLRFAAALPPSELVLQRTDQEQSTVLTPANPAVFAAELPLGIYNLSFRTKWNQGDVTYLLKVDVRAPATASEPRLLALTG